MMAKTAWQQRARLALAGAVLVSASGCASLVSQGALSPPMLNLDIASDEALSRIGYTTNRFCPPAILPTLESYHASLADDDPLCTSYLKASAYDAVGLSHWQLQADAWSEQAPLTTRAMEVRLRYWVGPSVLQAPSELHGDEESTPQVASGSEYEAMDYAIELNTTRGDDYVRMGLQREAAEAAPLGTYVLIHGFRTNKESLFFIAEAIRFHGYNVVLVDLFGHGESSGRFSFSGKPDSRQVSALIDTLPIEGDLHILGMSMGGTTSTHLAQYRDDVKSVTLLAPMWEFVDAFVDAGRAYTRTAHLLPQSALKKGAQHALDDVGTPLEDTAVVQQVGALGVPVLVMASANDKISPLDKLESLRGDTVTVHETAPRTHHGMILWDTNDVQIWRDWMQRLH